MKNQIVLFTMKGCSHCLEFKKMLKKNKTKFTELDIDDNKEEYEMFVEITENEFVPAFMIVESPDTDEHKSYLYAPDRDYNEIEEGVAIIKEHFGK